MDKVDWIQHVGNIRTITLALGKKKKMLCLESGKKLGFL